METLNQPSRTRSAVALGLLLLLAVAAQRLELPELLIVSLPLIYGAWVVMLMRHNPDSGVILNGASVLFDRPIALTPKVKASISFGSLTGAERRRRQRAALWVAGALALVTTIGFGFVIIQ